MKKGVKKTLKRSKIMHKNAFKVKMRTFAQKMTIVDVSDHPKLHACFKRHCFWVSADTPKTTSSFRPQNVVDGTPTVTSRRSDGNGATQSNATSQAMSSSATRREVRSYHHESYNSFSSKLVNSSR